MSKEQFAGLLKWRSIEPFRGGRVVAVAGDCHDRNVFYFGACAGGVWKTDDGGTFWKNISDGYFNTAAVGTEYTNPDGSSRQDTLQKVKAGEKIRLIWDARNPEKKPVVYLVRKGRRQQLSMPDCFGRLGDKVAADVCRWMTKENIVTAAQVVKIVGGTRKRPKLGCVLELSTYPAPEKKGIAKWLANRGY